MRWSLDRTPPAWAQAPELDADQQLVRSHRAGPLLVLAGPGTGKTTTIVESVITRLTDPQNPVRPDEVLVLTFGRRAAGELRTRITARAGGGAVPLIATFHSFAYALMRQFADPEVFRTPPRLLSGPEQQARIRELLAGSVQQGSVPWPAELGEALPTRGFAEEVRALIARVRGLGLEPADLQWLGEREGDTTWRSVGQFADDYLEVSDAENVLDYTEVMLRAVLVAEQHPDIRSRYRAVFVDEYQDTDPIQVRLLQALVTAQTSLVVVGDPDQAIYSFRGADVGGLLRFRSDFATPDGGEVPVVVLGQTRRFGPVIRAAASAVIGSRAPHGLRSEHIHRLRGPQCDPTSPPGSVEAVLCDDERVQADFIADVLRRAVLEQPETEVPLAWSDMAVLVRSGTLQIPALRRALVAAGVPVEVAGDELPLAREPAVIPLLMAADVVANQRALTPEVAESLLTSPLGGVDAADLRRMVRTLRRRERDERIREAAVLGIPPERPRSSVDVLVDLLADPLTVDAIDPGALDDAVRGTRRLARLLQAARELLDQGASPADVLWMLFSGTPWPRRLEQAALSVGRASRRANADLDAIVALFDEAERAVARHDRFVGLANFIDELQSQEIPASGLRESPLRNDAVRLLTAHRSKGLEWRLVVVAGVQEETWPDVRRRSSLLNAETLTCDSAGYPDVSEPPTLTELLAEERRLFYVACTRARERLIVTAVSSPDDEAGAQPSRFLSDLAVPVRQVGRSAAAVSDSVTARALTLEALVADLRSVLNDGTAPTPVREAAAQRLALLADWRTADGAIVAPAADPARWWGLLDRTDPAVPMLDPERPVPLSGSSLTAIDTCPLRWFLEHEARARSQTSTAMGFGTLVHAVADLVAREEVEADLEVLDGLLGRVWSQLGFEAPWYSRIERANAREALTRFLHWHGARQGVLLGSEVSFATPLTVRGAHGDVAVVLRGSMDVVEIRVDGEVVRVHVADLKTGGTVAAGDVPHHLQLGVYQAAVAHGAVTDQLSAGELSALAVESGGSSIVSLRDDAAKGAGGPKVYEQAAISFDGDEPAWIEQPLATAGQLLRDEQFWATPGTQCASCAMRWQCPAHDSGQAVVGQ